MQSKQITKLTKENVEEVFNPTGAKIVSFNEQYYGGVLTYQVEIKSTMLTLGQIQIARMAIKFNMSVFGVQIVDRGNKLVMMVEFMDTPNHIIESAQMAKGCGDL